MVTQGSPFCKFRNAKSCCDLRLQRRICYLLISKLAILRYVIGGLKYFDVVISLTMGVQNLWQLLSPTSNDIELQTLRNKTLAVDASIWIYTFIRSLHNQGEYNYILGFLRRICKLLFWNIKPVFVFDGSPPQLKQRILNIRNKRSEFNAKKVAHLIVNNPKMVHQLQPKNDIYKIPMSSEFVNDSNDVRMPLLPTEFNSKFEEYKYVSAMHRDSRSTNKHQHNEIHSTKDPLEFSKMQVRNVEFRHKVTSELHKVTGMQQEKKVQGNRLKTFKFSKSTSNVTSFNQQVPTVASESHWFDEDPTESPIEQTLVNDSEDVVDLSDNVVIPSEPFQELGEIINLVSDDASDDFESVTEDFVNIQSPLDFINAWSAFSPPTMFKIFTNDIFKKSYELTENEILIKSKELSGFKNSAFKESYLYLTQYLDALLIHKREHSVELDEIQIIESKREPNVSIEKVVAPQVVHTPAPASLQTNIFDLFKKAPLKEKVKIEYSTIPFKVDVDSPSMPKDHDKTLVNKPFISKFEPVEQPEMEKPQNGETSSDVVMVDALSTDNGSDVVLIEPDNKMATEASPNTMPALTATPTSEMLQECMHLLQLFGIPYIVAPQEAEAQCAYLNLNKLVDGIITDDSDVFLFGGSSVYRNIFKDNNKVEYYAIDQICNKLHLNRQDLVDLAQLLGSDYCTGYQGIGLITAVEILSHFKTLKAFNKYALMVQTGVKVEFTKFIKIAKKVQIPSVREQKLVEDAYMMPIVDENKAQFQFGEIQLDKLQEYLNEKLGWGSTKTKEMLMPIIKEQEKREMNGYQQTMTDYYGVDSRKEMIYGSKKLTKIMSEFKKK